MFHIFCMAKEVFVSEYPHSVSIRAVITSWAISNSHQWCQGDIGSFSHTSNSSIIISSWWLNWIFAWISLDESVNVKPVVYNWWCIYWHTLHLLDSFAVIIFVNSISDFQSKEIHWQVYFLSISYSNCNNIWGSCPLLLLCIILSMLMVVYKMFRIIMGWETKKHLHKCLHYTQLVLPLPQFLLLSKMLNCFHILL